MKGLPDMDDPIPWNYIENPLQFAYGAKVPNLPGPVPFIYDIKNDKIDVGVPNESIDTMGARYTPGGIVRGVYQPDGKLEIQSNSDYMYSTRHILDLWSWSQPSLYVKSVWLDTGDGGKPERIAHGTEFDS
jgi:hypothetical protein